MNELFVQQKDGFEYNLIKDDDYISIEFPDTYQQDLVDKYGWTEEDAQHRVDKKINEYIKNQGVTGSVYWEDRELFLLDNTTLPLKLVRDTLQKLFHS